jgi:hypothetical protein
MAKLLLEIPEQQDLDIKESIEDLLAQLSQ